VLGEKQCRDPSSGALRSEGLCFLQDDRHLHNNMAVIGLQNTTWTIPKSILLLWPGLYNIGSCCN
jgi:hypothetical protein